MWWRYEQERRLCGLRTRQQMCWHRLRALMIRLHPQNAASSASSARQAHWPSGALEQNGRLWDPCVTSEMVSLPNMDDVRQYLVLPGRQVPWRIQAISSDHKGTVCFPLNFTVSREKFLLMSEHFMFGRKWRSVWKELLWELNELCAVSLKSTCPTMKFEWLCRHLLGGIFPSLWKSGIVSCCSKSSFLDTVAVAKVFCIGLLQEASLTHFVLIWKRAIFIIWYISLYSSICSFESKSSVQDSLIQYHWQHCL